MIYFKWKQMITAHTYECAFPIPLMYNEIDKTKDFN